MRKITVVMEKGPGRCNYACYTLEDIPHFGIAGYGDTVEEARKDFFVAYEEIKELEAEQGRVAPELEFTFKYDMRSFFNDFPYLNISKLAERAEINPSQMKKFASGMVKVSQRHYDKILEAVHSIAKELGEAKF